MIHVAVLMKPYLDLVLAGEKTVECRLTQQARVPYKSIEPGDRIYFKQSAGPYRAIAFAEHVLFESDLTATRIDELRNDYDDLIRGEDAFWQSKRHSRYGTFIWLRDVEPIDNGPQIPPLQGRAWAVLEEGSAWLRCDAPEDSFAVKITGGNLRHNTLYVTDVIDRFPSDALGGATKREAGQRLTLLLCDGPTVETDIVAPRKLMRDRSWGAWFRRHGARTGDSVVFTPIDDRTFFVGLSRG